MVFIRVAIFSIVESSLEGRNLSYQQVIHKAKMPTGANLPIVLWSDIMQERTSWSNKSLPASASLVAPVPVGNRQVRARRGSRPVLVIKTIASG